MNDLMTKSFLSYVELKKQAQLEADFGIEKGQLNPEDEQNLSQFFQEVAAVKAEMEEITNLLLDLQSLNEDAKSTYSTPILCGLRDRMNSDMVMVFWKAKHVKTMLESLDQSNSLNRQISQACKLGNPGDRTRSSVTNGLKTRLREMMSDFHLLRDRIISDHKEDLGRGYYAANGEQPSEDVVEKMVSGGEKVKLFEGKTELDMGNKFRHEAVMDIQKSLNRLHQIFLDMAIIVETQGEKMDDIELNVAHAGSLISGGTNSLHYARQMKKNKKWVFWVWAVAVIILLVCLIAILAS